MAPSLGKRSGAAKGSRHTKKYWRKGTNVDDVVDSLHDTSREIATGGLVSEMKDDELFVIDREQNSNKIKVSKRQQAALDKISRSIDKDLVSLPKPKSKKIKVEKLPKGNSMVKKVVKMNKAQKKDGNYDIWNTDLEPKVKNLESKELAEHFLRTTKKKLPNAPAKSITSILPAVEVPHAGASYNPEAEEYDEYVGKIIQDEYKYLTEEEKIRKGIEPQWEQKITHGEMMLELTEGLKIDPRYKDDDDESDDEEEEEETKKEDSSASNNTERLSKKERRKKERAAQMLLEEKKRLEKKQIEKDSHNVYRANQINKELEQEEKEEEDNKEEKKKMKTLKRLTTRQRLGRGKFKDLEDPFLLKEELNGSLREVKPQGHVLQDRMKSMQRRNILPIGGEKAKRLKKTLKRKYVEKRSVKEITKGTRII